VIHPRVGRLRAIRSPWGLTLQALAGRSVSGLTGDARKGVGPPALDHAADQEGRMPYLRHTGAPQLSPDTVELLARVAGLTLPPEDVEPLAASLADQLASIALLDRLDLANVNPIVDFDPRWHDDD
jgi:hypothetical protein